MTGDTGGVARHGEEISLAERPAERVRRAVWRWGEPELIIRCVTLLRTGSWGDDPDLVLYLGGRHGQRLVEHGVGKEGYWLRVWPLRVMLYIWDDSAEPAVVEALVDDHWRVREMALKVVALRELGSAADAAAQRSGDPVARVRSAAARALGAVGEAEHAVALRQLLDDADAAVRRQAERALVTLADRIDVPLDRL